MERKKIFLVSLGHLSCDLNGGALPAALPYIRAAHSLDYQATGGLMLAYSCLSSLIQPLLGLLADRLQKPWFIPLGIFLAGAGISALGFMANYWAMFTAIAISGIGSAFFHPEGARFANRFSGKSKGTGLSLFSVGGNSGFIIGPLLVTVFVGAAGLRGMSVFGVIAIATASIMLWQIAKIRPSGQEMAYSSPQASKKYMEAAEIAAEDPLAAEGDELDAEIQSGNKTNNWRAFGKLTLVIVSRSITFAGCNTFIPLYWVNAFHQSREAGAFALVVFGCFGVACNLLGGYLGDRAGYIRIIRTAFSLMPIVVILFGLAPNAWWGWCLLPLLGFALYLPFSSQVVLGQKYLAKNIGFASGVTLGLAITLGGMAQPLLGWLADSFGLHYVFFCLAGISGVGCLFSFFLTRENADAR